MSGKVFSSHFYEIKISNNSNGDKSSQLVSIDKITLAVYNPAGNDDQWFCFLYTLNTHHPDLSNNT